MRDRGTLEVRYVVKLTDLTSPKNTKTTFFHRHLTTE